MWYLSPIGIGSIFAIIGIILYFMDISSKEESFDIISAIKYAILSGTIASGSVWTYSQLSSSSSLPNLSEEVFTGIPNF
jgi:hypothetical protein